MGLDATSIKDLVSGTLGELGRLHWTQLATKLQRYEVMDKLLREDKVKLDSGTEISRNLMLDDSGAARNVQLYEKDVVDAKDVMTSGKWPWRNTTTNWPVERREVAMNRASPQRIFDLVKTRRDASHISLAALMEKDFWSKPADSTDAKTPWGIRMSHVVGLTKGFTGDAPVGFAGGYAGVLHPRWRNWWESYAAVTKDDLIHKMREAYQQIMFVSPIGIDDPTYARKVRESFRIYCKLSTWLSFADIGETQNENLGNDLASKDGEMIFHGNALKWIPQLADETDDPVFFVNFGDFAIYCLEGEYMHEEVEQVAGQHTVTVTHVDTTWQPVCTNRRSQALLTLA